MSSNALLSRRDLVGGLGAAGVAAATVVGLPGVAAAQDPDQDDKDLSPAPPSVGISPRDLANPIVQNLTAGDFVPESNGGLTWVYAGIGGIVVTGGSQWFDGGLRLPFGAVIIGAHVFLNPSGAPRTLYLRRYRAIPASGQVVASATSTNGTAPEAVPLSVTHAVEAGWGYRFEIFLFGGGPACTGRR